MKATINRRDITELRELVEDTIEYFCDEKMISGEVTWTMVQCLAEAKLAEMKGELAS